MTNLVFVSEINQPEKSSFESLPATETEEYLCLPHLTN